MSPEWDDALADLEELLDTVALAAETGRWDELAFPSPVGSPPVVTPTPEQRARYAVLRVELDAAAATVREHMERTAAELGDGGRRRSAAVSYARTDGLVATATGL